MTIVTLCGFEISVASCRLCLQQQDCRKAREALCMGCIRTCCSSEFKHKRVEQGWCKGREMAVSG